MIKEVAELLRRTINGNECPSVLGWRDHYRRRGLLDD